MDAQETPRLGVIDSLSIGFRLVARRPWLLVLPVLLDLLLWLGPRVSVRPVMVGLLDMLEMSATVPQDMQEMMAFSQEVLRQIAERWNLLTLLTRGVVSVPSFLAGLFEAPPIGLTARIVELPTLTSALGGVVLTGVVGTLLGGLYLLLIAVALRRATSQATTENGAERRQFDFLQRLGRTWVQLLGFVLLLLLTVLIVIVPLSLISVVLGLISQGLALSAVSLLSMAVLTAFMWAGFVLTFVAESIVLEGTTVVQAIWRSANVVWRNLWPTLGLVLLSYVITVGFTFIWDRAARSTVGTAVGILGTAFIGAGLSAAALAFYADRRQQLEQAESPPVV